MPSNAKGQTSYGNHKCLRPYECFSPVLRTLKKYIHIHSQGRYNAEILLRFIIGLCLERQSIHSMQDLFSNRPSETAFRHHMAKLDMDELKELNHRFLIEPIKDILPRNSKCYFAIDTTDDPYYGEITSENEQYIHRRLTKRSTNHFYTYTTLYLIEKDRKFTIATVPVTKDKHEIYYLKYFVSIIDDLNLQIGAILMDRIYYSVDIFSYLGSRNIPYIVPVKKQGKRMKKILSCRRSGIHKYTMKSHNFDKTETELTVSVCRKYHKGRFGKSGVMPLGYFVYGLDWKPNKIASVYKRRFSIESSYRMRNLVRPRTSTKNPTIRYVFALVSMLLKNVWVGIRWRYFTKIIRGPKRIDEDYLRFDRFRLILWEFIKGKMKFKKTVLTLRPNG